MNPYAGSDAFPVSVDLPDDSDPPASATFKCEGAHVAAYAIRSKAH
jgi:hypothetical protein